MTWLRSMVATLNASLAALGLVATGAVAAIVTTGAIEGWRPAPGWAASAAGVTVFLGALGLAGNVTVQLDPRRPLVASGVASLIVAGIGLVAARVSEHATGEGLEPTTVAAVVAGLFAMLASSAALSRRRRRTRPAPEGPPPRP